MTAPVSGNNSTENFQHKSHLYVAVFPVCFPCVSVSTCSFPLLIKSCTNSTDAQRKVAHLALKNGWSGRNWSVVLSVFLGSYSCCVFLSIIFLENIDLYAFCVPRCDCLGKNWKSKGGSAETCGTRLLVCVCVSVNSIFQKYDLIQNQYNLSLMRGILRHFSRLHHPYGRSWTRWRHNLRSYT